MPRLRRGKEGGSPSGKDESETVSESVQATSRTLRPRDKRGRPAEDASRIKRVKTSEGEENVSSEKTSDPEDGPRKWLMKAEAETRVVRGVDVKFSIDDLELKKVSPWDGVRNYAARNMMRRMKVGDQCFFYHSNCKHPGIVGIAEVVREAYPDHTAWDPTHPYYDAKTKPGEERWWMVDVKFIRKLRRPIGLSELRRRAQGDKDLDGMELLRRGRLSVQPVAEREWRAVLGMEMEDGEDGE